MKYWIRSFKCRMGMHDWYYINYVYGYIGDSYKRCGYCGKEK